jgi:hypothetical protein
MDRLGSEVEATMSRDLRSRVAFTIASPSVVLGDSVVYACVLVALFIPKARAASPAAAPANAG